MTNASDRPPFDEQAETEINLALFAQAAAEEAAMIAMQTSKITPHLQLSAQAA
jgi:hypothetical protein